MMIRVDGGVAIIDGVRDSKAASDLGRNAWSGKARPVKSDDQTRLDLARLAVSQTEEGADDPVLLLGTAEMVVEDGGEGQWLDGDAGERA